MHFATGAMGTLLPKLGKLLLEEYKLKKSVKNGIGELKAELESMQAALVKVSSVPLDQLDPQVKIWANEVRELSYAIEDSLDSFMTSVDDIEPTKPNIKNLLKKVRDQFTKFKARHEIANDIKHIDKQVRKIKERRDRYKINDSVASFTTTTVDPRLSALYNKASDLVGIDKAIDEVRAVLSEGVDMSENNLKIVSIVGFGGLGKTTLARALYDKLKKKYQCQGFVPVGQRPDMKKVLRDILLELDMELYKAASTMDERQLINQLQKFLEGKRYFIVIDDLWDIPTWEMIKFAFMYSHPESRLIITTRIIDVATKAGGVYNMEPLSDDNSKMLFHTRTCCGEGVSADNQPAEVTNKILTKCGGVPLAIITIASLLVGKQSEDWSKVYDAIGFGHEDNEVVRNTRKILSFSYYDLPAHLKTCLLYLSMFPEDSFIEKRTLIWRWISEGIVLDREGIGSFKLGEIYFNELVNKSMIQWIVSDEYKKILDGCRVHDMVLDLIHTMSSDANFVTLDDMEQHDTCLQGKRTNMIRRLALNGRNAEHNSSIKMEHVRSFNVTRCGDNRIPPLLSFKVLRVLVIEDCVFPEGHNLEHLGKLVHLRYLGLVKTKVNNLPEGIGYDLKFLEILDVRGGLVRDLPPSVGELRNLRCLWTNRGTMMKGNIGKLTCLEELHLHSVDKCPNFFTEIGKLTKLRVLEIHFGEITETASKDLVESLCSLPKIHMLTVWPGGEYVHVLGGSLQEWAPSSKLRLLTLPRIIIPRMPSWINYLCVPLLSHLCLQVEVVNERDIQALGSLPSLLYLILRIEGKCISYTFDSDEFPKLKSLITKNVDIAIVKGALPMLVELLYFDSPIGKDVVNLVPWSNSCPLLEKVTCFIECTNISNSEVKKMETALWHASRIHPKAEDLRLSTDRYNYVWEASEFIDELESILCGLDKPEEVDHTIKDEEISDMITSLQTLLCDAEPRVGRYGEQEIHDIVTKLKSLLQEEAHNGVAVSSGRHLEGGSTP